MMIMMLNIDFQELVGSIESNVIAGDPSCGLLILLYSLGQSASISIDNTCNALRSENKTVPLVIFKDQVMVTHTFNPSSHKAMQF